MPKLCSGWNTVFVEVNFYIRLEFIFLVLENTLSFPIFTEAVREF